MTIHREGYATLIISFALFVMVAVLLYLFARATFPFYAIVASGIFVFLVSFFRYPSRTAPAVSDGTLLSPCDGKVVVIEKVYEPEYLKRDCLQVSIFMSPLNVHVNWHPADGKVSYQKYHPGKYLAAWNPKSSTENERTSVGYKLGCGEILMRQVAGALARRIVCYTQQGEISRAGEEMGFIKFGSRVDLYLPVDTALDVEIGDRVTGKQSIIGRCKAE